VTFIGYDAFYKCTSLTDVFYEGTKEEWNNISDEGFFMKDTVTVHYSSSISDFEIVDGVLVRYHGSGGDVIIPDGVVEIGNEAFYGRTDMTSVVIPRTVKKIDDQAFNACNSLTSINIPEGVTYIGQKAFSRCGYLKTVSLPSTLRIIDIEAFSFCNSIVTMSVPEGVTTIMDSAFHHCTDLVSVSLPSTLVSIGNSAFSLCPNLRGWTLNPDNTAFVIENDVLYDKGKTRLLHCLTGKSGYFSIPYTVRSIDSSAFAYCGKLTGLWIPSGVSRIPSVMLFESNAVKTVSIPISVTEFAPWSFTNCEITDIYYEGSPEEWNGITKTYTNDEDYSCCLSEDVVIHYESYNTSPDFEIVDGALKK
jgi:hypothetical protein